MAFLEQRNNRYRLVFVYRGKRYARSLKRADQKAADAICDGANKLLWQLEQGFIEAPHDVDIQDFVVGEGKVKEKPKPKGNKNLTLAELCDAYEKALAGGAVEENSLATVKMHLRHFKKTFGDGFHISTLTQPDLQRHVDRRTKVVHGGKALSPVTLRKEMTSFSACWNWGVQAGLVTGQFPNKGLKYPKGQEKPPFRTRDEIDRVIQRGALSAQESAELWECLYLTVAEVEAFLAFIKEHAQPAFLYPLCCLAAHTGARRSELLRARLQDVDLEAKVLSIHERKRSKEQRTTRAVPLSDFVCSVLTQWISEHPGGACLFCQEEFVERSKKRGRTTGHQWGEKRAKTVKGRLATVHTRERPEIGPLTHDEVHDHFKRTLIGGKWNVVRGLHVLRHSFISACASRNVDQRLIDEWVGHQTEEQRKRYRHLYPSVQREALQSVFGGK